VSGSNGAGMSGSGRVFPHDGAGSAVVVGAGLSGLVAAYRLQQRGVAVTLLEQQDTPGGRVRTERHGGYLIDTGPDAITASYRRYLAIMEELGLADRVVRASQVVGFVRGGRVIDVDPGRPWALPFSQLLSPMGKLRMVRGAVTLRREARGVDPYDLIASAHRDAPDSNAWELAMRHFGPEITDYVIDGVMRLVSTTGARGASPLGLLAALNAWAVPLLNVRGGLEVLPNELAKHVDIGYGASVQAVSEGDARVTVSYTGATGREETIDADACVISTFFDDAVRIWPRLGEFAPRSQRHPYIMGGISLSLGYAARTRSRAYIVSVPTREQPDALLVFMQHNKAPDRAPAGHSLITIYTDMRVAEKFLGMSDEDVVAWGTGIIEGWCPELAGRRECAVLTRWPRLAYMAFPGYYRWSAGLFDALPRDCRVQVGGDLIGAPSMESAICGGERAAQRISDLLPRRSTMKPTVV
jgi:protoporphyrinogen/coproporphyrinogen III oxidase